MTRQAVDTQYSKCKCSHVPYWVDMGCGVLTAEAQDQAGRRHAA